MATRWQSGRTEAQQMGLIFFYASEPGSPWEADGDSADEATFQETIRENPDWFLLNDGASTNLKIHRCGCPMVAGRMTTYNWPKIIGQELVRLEQWAAIMRPNNPVVACSRCLENFGGGSQEGGFVQSTRQVPPAKPLPRNISPGWARDREPIDRDLYLDRLVEALRRAFNDAPPKRKFGGWDTPAMNVLDSVLSLNRRYYSFCEPRLDRFKAARPEVKTVSDLIGLIDTYPTPLAFSIKELEYNDENRAGVLVGVLRYLAGVESSFYGETEAKRLRQWAVSVTPDDYTKMGVRGFALSGFQYLRMLLGANTAKPDIHIRRFVSEAVGSKVSDTQALALLEQAAKRLGWELESLDNEIWELRAQSRQLQ